MSAVRQETDVLIVGLGPTGAVLAGLLAQWGVRSIAIDRDREIYRLPRAAHFDHEIMRVFQQLGIADELLPQTRPLSTYEFRNAAGEILMQFSQGENTGPLGWRRSYMFHQPALERALRAKLATLDEVAIHLGASLTAIERNDEAGVVASVACDDGTSQTISARFLVGCDGGTSVTRKLADIDLFDFGFDEPWLVIDTVMADDGKLPSCGLQVCDPKRPTTVMPMAPGRRRWEFMLRPEERAEDALDDAFVARLLAPWAAAGEAQIIRKAVYRFHGLVATRWREKSVLLAGDAAHQMPPFMGQGMCSGIRDAANLAWRLALVLKHGASGELLDAYQEERDPHVHAIIQTAIAMGRIVCTMDEDAAAARDKSFLAQRVSASRPGPAPGIPGLSAGTLVPSPQAGELFPQPPMSGKRFDDAMGRGFWLVSRDGADSGSPLLKAIDARDYPQLLAWLDEAKAEAALVRPDRYVLGTGEAKTLLEAFAALRT